MEMALRTSNLLLPEGFVEMDCEEMMYVGGGHSVATHLSLAAAQTLGLAGTISAWAKMVGWIAGITVKAVGALLVSASATVWIPQATAAALVVMAGLAASIISLVGIAASVWFSDYFTNLKYGILGAFMGHKAGDPH